MNEQGFIRDKRSPIPKSTKVSQVMSANKSKNTKPELLLRKLLSKNKIRGYRLNWKKAPGKPDIAFPGRRIAIFVNGCFWHRCPTCALNLPKHNTEFWKTKFEMNLARDKRKTTELQKSYWTVITVWECQLKSNPDGVIENILKEVGLKA